MPDQLEIRGPHGERLVTPVGSGGFVVGSAPDADVRLAWPDIAKHHFRFVRTDGGVRIEPVRAGGTVEVNGEALFCKDLVAGDVIEVSGVRLRWLPAEPTPESTADAIAAVRAEFSASGSASKPRPRAGPAAAPGRSDRPRGRSRESTAKERAGDRKPRRTRSRGMPVWVLVLGLVVASVAIAWIVVGRLGGSTWPHTPQHYVDLARQQFANHQTETALNTLAFALRDATGATRNEALQLEAEIKRILVEAAEMPKVLAARQEHDVLLGFRGDFLGANAARPAAREFVRLCDDWLQRYREVCGRVRDGQPLLRTIEDERARWTALAATTEAETAADVIFAANSRLRFRWRDYRGALARLDAFLASNPGDAAVRAEREKIAAQGAEWVQTKLRAIDGLISRNQVDIAEKDLGELARRALPEWEAMLAERRQRLGAR